jgi:methionyl-tRNA formyltransferase
VSGIALLVSKAAGLALMRFLVEEGLPVCGILTPDDRADSRSVLDDIRAAASAAGLSCVVDDSADAVEEHITAWGPDLILVLGWYRRIAVERWPTVPVFGFHGSPLPRYRGGAPIVWQIIEGEPRVGLTMFRLAAGIDDGDVVAVRYRAVALDETIADVLPWLGATAIALVREHIGSLLAGETELTPQDHSRATYCSLRYPSDGRIDWRMTARRVHDFVRAQTAPYPGAFTETTDGRSVHIWRTRLEPRTWLGPPGRVIDILSDGVVVACAEGAVIVTEATVAGEPGRPVSETLGTRHCRFRS